MNVKLRVVDHEPLMEVIRDSDDFIFVELGFLVFKAADIDLNDFGPNEAKIRVEVRVFVENAEL